MNALQKKLRAVEEEDAAEKETAILAAHDEAKYARALMLLGGIRAVNRIAQNLSSQTMNALIVFQKEDMHQQLGFNRFADFLDQSEYAPMSKNDFYRRKELFEAEGDAKYDLFNEAKISLSTRKLLASGAAGQISIEDDEIIIGDERADLSDLPTIKELIKTLADESRQLTETGEKNKKHFEKLKEQIAAGQKEYDELRRAVDASAEGSPYEIALTKAVAVLIKLAMEANNLPLMTTQTRGEGDLAALWQQMVLVRNALQQPNFKFPVDAPNGGVSDLTKKVFADDDDFGDEYEQ